MQEIEKGQTVGRSVRANAGGATAVKRPGATQSQFMVSSKILRLPNVPFLPR